MNRFERLIPHARAAAALSLGGLIVGFAPILSAAEPAAEVEEVVVTGTYIRGTPEDAALPVDVITAESLQEQGSPDIIEMVQRLPSVSGGTYGQSNRFLGTSAQGAATVNLRGLGAFRTLVLMNGQRLSKKTFPGGAEQIDIAQIPFAAIGRVEVLRDGAAVTYGSDAVAGVVNFITRRDLEGFEVSGSFTDVEDSDGDYDISVAYGWNNDSGNVLLAADYARTSEIRLYDVPFMLPKPPGQGDGISLAANPGTYFTVTNPVDTDQDGFFESASQGTVFRDLGCSELGAFTIGATACTYPFVQQESPVNDEDRYHLFGEVNFDLSDTLRFHGEGFYSYHEVPHNKVSVTLSTTQFPTPIEASGASPGGGTSPYPAIGGDLQSRFYVPADNPGLVALMTDNGCPFSQAVCDQALANGVITSQTGWRPRALGGSPLFDGDTDPQKSLAKAWRISGGLDGDFANGWGWTTRLTYANDFGKSAGSDLSVNRIQLGLRGLGGEGCDPNTGTPGEGPCEWFNPFANSIERSIVNGKSYAEAVGRPLGPLNTKSLWNWMRNTQVVEITSELVTAEAVVNGDFGPAVELPGGPIQWVVGTQWRWDHRTVRPAVSADSYATPCVDSPPFGDGSPSCAVPGVGPLSFNSQTNPSDLELDVPSVFGELSFPILDNLELGIAGRHEEYGGSIGNTDDYRVSVRWEALPWLVLRGSTGTTFRAPPPAATETGFSRIQAQFANPTNGALLYRPQDIFGNPGLQPETADTYNVGFVIATDEIDMFGADIGRFDFSLDYFSVTFKDEITGETGARVYGAMFPSANPAAWGCANDDLRERFRFTTTLNTNEFVYDGETFPECHPDNFLSLATQLGNGREDTDISGVDLAATWTRDGVFGGELSFSMDASYLDEWKRGAQYLVGTDVVFEAATDRAGTAELLSGFYSYAQWRGNGHINYRNGIHNLHFASHYYQGVQDRNRGLTHRDSHVTYDAVYMVELPWETIATVTVSNFTDEEPPYIRSQYNYDYMNYSWLGRTIKLGVKKTF